jgi:hypothetical protein
MLGDAVTMDAVTVYMHLSSHPTTDICLLTAAYNQYWMSMLGCKVSGGFPLHPGWDIYGHILWVCVIYTHIYANLPSPTAVDIWSTLDICLQEVKSQPCSLVEWS